MDQPEGKLADDLGGEMSMQRHESAGVTSKKEISPWAE
jgi:hypothetical protein